MDNKTPGNFGYGDMSGGYRTRYKMMIDLHNREKEMKKKKKKKSILETIAEKLYGGKK